MDHVILLGSEDRAGSGNSDPTNKGFGSYLIMLHTVQTDEGASASKACFAMYCNSSCVRIGKMILTGAQKLLDDIGWRS